LICVGIQNKWSAKDATLYFPAMQRALGHFVAKMLGRGWKSEQLFFIFILKNALPVSLSIDSIEDRFHGNVAIISTRNQALEKWLSPSLQVLVERFTLLSPQWSLCQTYVSELSSKEYPYAALEFAK
jgi:hypothetical protein